jgi:hypothetical protein
MGFRTHPEKNEQSGNDQIHCNPLPLAQKRLIWFMNMGSATHTSGYFSLNLAKFPRCLPEFGRRICMFAAMVIEWFGKRE